ncbi:uncharacterized protein RJT21DRAFT_120479 [Scheffersomyces amazonensis]|uniref:uncharacterized protein n=1 Tax=Scheffersomyces amazonensis TaxID=1078765 RepID=UPI00315D0FBF
MEEQIPTFLAVTGIEDEAVAKQFLELTNGDLEYAVTLFMESNHPQVAPTITDSNNNNNNEDEELAQRLQQEAYGESTVREADSTVHRHEQLIESNFHYSGPSNLPTDMFGTSRGGVFNQRFDEEENRYYRSMERRDSPDSDEEYHDANTNDYGYGYDNEDNNNEDDEIMIIDSDEHEHERDRPLSRRRRLRESRINELTATQRRLAELFRPPFDIISPINIDTAKQEGKANNKWILINIQDATDFQSQVLNRDFWSKSDIKSIIKENFIFLQYHHDSPNGISYTNFYSVESFPHIAILDPLTGERVLKWKDGEVPTTDKWIDDVQEFLSKFSLHPDSKNPTVKHEVVFDPDTLSEEQQIEYALKQSILANGGNSVNDAIPIEDSQDSEGEGDDDQESPQIEQEPEHEKEPESIDPFDQIKPIDHQEPSNGAVTRIQIRFPNGKRLVHKFNLSDTILIIFQWLKYVLQEHADEYGLSSNDRFILSNSSAKAFKFIESLDINVEEASLKNASILLEKE